MGTGRSPPNRTATISTRNPNCLTHQLPHLGVTWRHPPDSSHSVAPRKLFPDVKDHRHPKNFPHLPQTGSLFPSCFTTNIYICVCVCPYVSTCSPSKFTWSRLGCAFGSAAQQQQQQGHQAAGAEGAQEKTETGAQPGGRGGHGRCDFWHRNNMGVSINGCIQKWMVYKGKSIYKWMITGGTPILGNHQMYIYIYIIQYSMLNVTHYINKII